MEIQIFLNQKYQAFSDLQADLATEFNALPNVEVAKHQVPPPPGTLAVHEAVQFVLNHPTLIPPMLTGVFSIIRAALRRHRPQDTANKEIPIVVVVADNRLPFPCSVEREKKFVSKVFSAKGKAKRTRKKRKGA